MTMLQNEWDDLMLETHTLKQHLDQTRQELSQALYQVSRFVYVGNELCLGG